VVIRTAPTPSSLLGTRPERASVSQAGLIAVGEPTIEKALDKALTRADKVVKRTVDATADEIASELQEALKGLGSGARGPLSASVGTS
jgi:hypothetical protein